MLIQIVLTGTNVNHYTLFLFPTKLWPIGDKFFGLFFDWIIFIYLTSLYFEKF